MSEIRNFAFDNQQVTFYSLRFQRRNKSAEKRTLNDMKKDIFFKAIPVTERQPKQMASIHVVLIDGRLPMMAQYNPQGWCYLSGIPASKEPQVIGGKGVSHWLEQVEALQIAEILERASYPPIVRAVLSCLEIMRSEEGIDNWAGVSITGMLRTYDNRPEKIEGGWRLNIGYSRQVFSMPVFGIDTETAETLLFERTPDGWKWAFAEKHKQEK